MTISELSLKIGTHCLLEPYQGLQFRVRITNVKQAYGRSCVQVEAVDGIGSAWVNLESISPCYPDQPVRKGGR